MCRVRVMQWCRIYPWLTKHKKHQSIFVYYIRHVDGLHWTLADIMFLVSCVCLSVRLSVCVQMLTLHGVVLLRLKTWTSNLTSMFSGTIQIGPSIFSKSERGRSHVTPNFLALDANCSNMVKVRTWNLMCMFQRHSGHDPLQNFRPRRGRIPPESRDP